MKTRYYEAAINYEILHEMAQSVSDIISGSKAIRYFTFRVVPH